MSATILEIRHVHVLLTGSAHDDESVLPNSVPRIRITEPKMLPDSRWNGRWIQASPYEEDSHLTDLGPLDVQSQLFALALMSLRSADNNYQSVFYEQALNWSEVKAQLQKLTRDIGINWQRQDFYVVEFRSTLKEGIDLPLLFRLDKESHREAAESGGLLKCKFTNLLLFYRVLFTSCRLVRHA